MIFYLGFQSELVISTTITKLKDVNFPKKSTKDFDLSSTLLNVYLILDSQSLGSIAFHKEK